MHIVQAFFLWFFVSSLMIGGAFAFRYFFPRESPWFGFIVPPLAFVILLNFIEHFVALPNLLPLTPVLVGVLAWLAAKPGYSKRELLLPSVVFLAAFAFTFGIRCLQPDIIFTSDGLADLNKINNYCQGDTLPPIDTWLPPFKYEWYYSLQHYAASIIKRLLDIKIGVAYNVTHALLSALTCVAGAAAAHRISGGKTWITLAVPFLIESAATGTSAYIQLTMHDPSLWLADNIAGGYDDLAHNNPDNPIWKLLAAPHHERLELQVPGFWTWRDEFHANSSGHFLTLLAVFVIAELVSLQKAIWPWVFAVLTPLIAVVASTWAYPITGLLCGGGVVIALLNGRRPDSLNLTMLALFSGLLLLWPALYDVTSSPEVPNFMLTNPEERAPLMLFLIQWWPIILLWIYGCSLYRELSPAVRWVLVVIPVMLIGIEIVSVEGRYNTVEKMWGYTYGTGLIALFPVVASRATLPSRILTVVLFFSAFVSMSGWLRNASEWLPWGRWPDAEFQLQGTHYITTDDQKNRMLQVLTPIKHATFLTGKCVAFNYYESPALAVFTENRSYATWTYFESVANYRAEAEYREKQNNDFYSGAMTNRLQFLQSHNITGVLIWPDDNIPNDVLAALTTELDPAYDYIDCKGSGDNNAGVFLLRSLPKAN
ncbi:MAG: DUF2298 domain-containing protein [Methylacidiphilales bacterium]|nr:DUF2298 domain-containing protein [Candidatus Methylacidiphilales bacterium]